MRVVRVIGHLLLELLIVAVELVLLPLRLAAMLSGGGLLIAGMLGLPAWLIQLAISQTDGRGGGGPLPAWEMCLLLAVAVPAGIALIELATLGTNEEPESSGEPRWPIEETAIVAFRGQLRSDAWTETGRVAATTLPRLEVRGTNRLSARVAKHELRVRRASRAVTGLRHKRRGRH
jgi:hypothetical protein